VNHSTLPLLLLLGATCSFASHRIIAADVELDRTAALAFLKQHCIRCHNVEKPKGKIRVDDLTGDVRTEGTRWSLILQQLHSGEMPPEGSPQPEDAAKAKFVRWATNQLAYRPQPKPNQGNLVPHQLLFGSRKEDETKAIDLVNTSRLWRVSPAAYKGWVRDVMKGEPKGLVQPFSAPPEKGIKDFAELARIDEPSTEILLRNAELIVQEQTRHTIAEGKVQPKHDTVREFTVLMAPIEPKPELVEKAIHKQFQLALGRTATAEEVKSLAGLYAKCAHKGDYPGAARTMLTAILLKSDAIFRRELGRHTKDLGGVLTPREAALAIGATLTLRREPIILTAAEKGKLSSREELAQHVRRILDEAKIEKPRLLGFFREYYEYHNATEVFKDEPKDLWHRPDQAIKDTDRLVLHLLAQDKDVFRQMLITPLAFVNLKTGTNKTTRKEEFQRALIPNAHNQRGKATPEALYGLTEWTPLQPITQKERTRIGILMQPSWLTAWSENFHNDIVRRGRFVRERLLGGSVPELPIGVAAAVPNDKTRTLRDRVVSTTSAGDCRRCHKQMDDLGLPFEGFDHYGRLLTTDQVLDEIATKANVDSKGRSKGEVYKSVPLDTRGAITGTGDPKLDGPVKDAYELITRIADSDLARQVWIRHVFRYYLGRNETLADAPTLREMDRVYLKSGGSYKELLVCLLTSDSFLKRSSATAASK
jgi:hypothetical protein